MILKKFQHDVILKKIGAIADKNDMKVWAVGGYVRDRLLEKSVNEIDFVVLNDGPAFARLALEGCGGSDFVIYPKFETASFKIENLKCEFVTARKESYVKHSRNPLVEKSTLKDDLLRRDFTVNALALSVNKKSFGHIHDPLKGRKDIKNRLLKTPLDPAATFSDDPLRMMRAARFACQLEFEIAPEVMEAMRNERERIRIVSQERITEELMKMLSQKKPSIGLSILQQTQIMDIVFPELAALAGVEQRDEHHHKDVFEHTLKVVDNVAAANGNLMLRFSALVHDIGKPRVKQYVKGIGWTFHGHEWVGVKMLKSIIPRLKLSRDFLKYAEKLTNLHMRPIQLIGEDVTDSGMRRLLLHSGEHLEDLMTLCRADITSGNPGRVAKHLANFNRVAQRLQEVEEKDRMRAFQPPLRGDEIMSICGLNPGPAVGSIKKEIEEAILDGRIPNEYEAAKDYLYKIKDRFIERDET